RAERDGLESLETPDWLAGDTEADQSLRMYFEEQRKEFDIRLARFKAERGVLLQRIAVYEESVAELEAQQKAVARQLEVIREELAIKKHLLDRGLTPRTEYAALLRSEADLIGQAGSVEAQLAAS